MHVAVVGAGVAGLTVAHELAERGYSVEVFERLPVAGGKARSVVVGAPGLDGLPGEHGFRYFASFYRHVIDTMGRIRGDDGRPVVEHLVAATTDSFARPDGPPLPTLSVGPTSIRSLIAHVRDFAALLGEVGAADAEFFAGRLWQVMTSCDDRRNDEYDLIPWSTFIDAAARDDAYRQWFAGAFTRTLIAASADDVSTRTVGDITVVLSMDGWRYGAPADRLLDGPTSDVWIGPWQRLLEGYGVRFHFDTTVTRIDVDPRHRSVTALHVEGPSGTRRVTADCYVLAVPVERMAALVDDDLAELAPSLAAARTIGDSTEWMSGIQFYLRDDVPIVHGHVVFFSSPWGLTAISQNQFWQRPVDTYGDHHIGGVLSVDVSSWSGIGTNGKTAFQCTHDEFALEVLAQLRACLPELPAEALSPPNVVGWFIDPDIVFYGDDGVPERNDEPLFVSRVGTRRVRPQATTEVVNLFLASDYVATVTDLATMETANEAGRRAANGVLDRLGSPAQRCRLWELHLPLALAPYRWADARRYRRGQPWHEDVPRVVHWVSNLLHWLEHGPTRRIVHRCRQGRG